MNGSFSLFFLVFFIFEPNTLDNQHNNRNQDILKSEISKKRLRTVEYDLFMKFCYSNQEITRIQSHQRYQIGFMLMKNINTLEVSGVTDS